MKLFAPAKINLHLRVAPVTSDGFHPLLSWMCTIGLFDTLTLIRAGESGIRLSCDDPSLPCDGTNLIVRAAAAMRTVAVDNGSRLGRDPSNGRTVGEGGLAIELQKRVPMGGGLGGGSSDAAHVILGLNRLWGLKMPIERLSAVAATIGSDVAFFCHGPSSICQGRGQIVRPIAIPTPRWVLLILPPMAVPTGPVYRRFDELLSQTDRAVLADAVALEPDWEHWRSMSANELLPHLVNDLERPAFDLYPALARCREQLEQRLGRIVRMSGSGSSLFTLFDDRASAEQAAEMIDQSTGCQATAIMLAPQIDDDLSAG